MYAKKGLGQNFLMHTQTAARIVAAAGVQPGDTVLEIGPGRGMLTRELLTAVGPAGKVVAVEADGELVSELEELFKAQRSLGNLEIVPGDVRDFPLESVPAPYKVVANIPYYITGELFRYVLGASHKPISVTFLVQKEVAERIARAKKESLLSLSVKIFGTPAYCFTVPRGAFKPAPGVDSAVLSVTGIRSPFASGAEEARFFKLIHAGFAHKRKQLLKNLALVFGDEKAASLLGQVSLAPSIRAEDVPLPTWLALAKIPD